MYNVIDPHQKTNCRYITIKQINFRNGCNFNHILFDLQIHICTQWGKMKLFFYWWAICWIVLAICLLYAIAQNKFKIFFIIYLQSMSYFQYWLLLNEINSCANRLSRNFTTYMLKTSFFMYLQIMKIQD